MRIDVFVELAITPQRIQEYAVCIRSIHQEKSLVGYSIVPAVGSPCVQSLECGDSGECSNRICACKANRKAIDTNDYYGQKIQICINGRNSLIG